MKLLTRIEELLLLAVWRTSDNAYVITIHDELRRVTGKSPAFGAIHVTLERLERRGFVRSSMTAPEPRRGGRSRRVYEIAEKGRRALAEIQRIEREMWSGIPDLALE